MDYVDWKECFPHQYQILLTRSQHADNRGKSPLLELGFHSLELIPDSHRLRRDSIDVVMKQKTTGQNEPESGNSKHLY